MCGINGLLYFQKDQKVDEKIILKMIKTIEHRGPDDYGVFCEDNVGLGFRRLSIIDLKSGHQPLLNQDKSLIIVFNGEIYNYREKRKFLLSKGYKFNTESDTEVILHLYEEFGEDCVQHLRGMFAFVIWDKCKQKLFCARDRLGIKPFYYYIDNDKFVFGSEIKAILACENVDMTISQTAIDSYFSFGYVTGDLSIYDKIKKLAPAYTLSISFNKSIVPEINKYWEINYEPDDSKTEKYWAETIESKLDEIVKMHMVSDVPLGAFLSGGIDSSIIVAMMAKNTTRPVKTFSIGFEENKFNETVYARELAKFYECEHHEQIIKPNSVSLLPDLANAFDEPFADASAIPTYYVSKFAREEVTVVLTGDGGDELFAGYSIYNYLNKIYGLSFSIPLLNQLLWGSVNKIIPSNVKGKGLTYFLSKNKKYLGAYLNVWTLEERKKLIKFNNYDSIKDYYAESIKRKIVDNLRTDDFITNLQLLDLKTYLVDDILTKVDRASMQNSLEARVPLLDHEFVELAFKIPRKFKSSRRQSKYIFKQAMKNKLPSNILKRKKKGFSLPLSIWFGTALKDYMVSRLTDNNAYYKSYLNEKYIKEILKAFGSGNRDNSNKIWTLLFFEEWLRQQK